MEGLLHRLFAFLLLAGGAAGAQPFHERALALGVDHHVYDPSAMAGGVAVLDFNNDGYDDIYFTGGLAPDRLYENRGDGTFTDVTVRRRITAFNGIKTMGVVAGDVDNDGFTDLFVTTAEGHRCYLLRNEGGAYFTDVSLPAGIRHGAWSTTAAMADYDLDGDLDIYVGNYLRYDALPFERNITAPEADFLYRNAGDGTFTLEVGPLPADEAGCTLVASFSDYDHDGAPDLFVLNDFGDFYRGNKLLRNGPGDFADVSDSTGMNAAINCMGIATGDLNEDGLLDYYLTNIGDNILYEGAAGRTFTDVAADRYVNDGSGTSWGTVIQDFDNDGHTDIYVNKGSLGGFDGAQYNRLYLGSGAAEVYDDVSRSLVVPARTNRARGVAYGDFNRDGSLDLAVANIRVEENNTAKSLVYLGRPVPGNHWLALDLRGTSANRSAYGTRVTLYAGGRRMIRELSGGASYLSSHSQTVHFGLGTTSRIDSILIDWPQTDSRETIVLPAVDRRYAIFQDKGVLISTTATRGVCPGSDTSALTEILPARDGGLDTLVQLRRTEVATLSDCVRTPTDETTDIVASPNPFNANLTLRLPEPTGGVADICLYDTGGRLVHTAVRHLPPATRSVTLDRLPRLAAGPYILHIRLGGTTHHTLVVRR